MLWLALMAGGSGFLLGLTLVRVQGIAVASATLILLCVGIAPLMHWSPLVATGGIVAMVVALQGGYLVGAGITAAWMSARAKRPAAASSRKAAGAGAITLHHAPRMSEVGVRTHGVPTAPRA